tara:strand:- start:603 stop:767 length:165 start_codon:yes stop_codon:yes gene_type:complete
MMKKIAVKTSLKYVKSGDITSTIRNKKITPTTKIEGKIYLLLIIRCTDIIRATR